MLNANEQGTEFGHSLSRFLNSFGTEKQKAAVKVLVKDHPSLQQATMRFFMLFAEELAKNATDQRNEAAVTLAKAIMALPAQKRALPLI